VEGLDRRAEEEAGDARSAVDMAKDTLRLEIEKYRKVIHRKSFAASA